MGDVVSGLKINSPELIFNYLKKIFGDKRDKDKCLELKKEKNKANLFIPGVYFSHECTIGLVIKPNDEGQILCVWCPEPVGYGEDGYLHEFHPFPFITLETFKDGPYKDNPQFEIHYKIGMYSSGTFHAYIDIISFIECAVKSVSSIKTN